MRGQEGGREMEGWKERGARFRGRRERGEKEGENDTTGVNKKV